MRADRLLLGLVTALAVGCASGDPDATSIVEPRWAGAELPLEWFAENWGPFDAALNRGPDGRWHSMLIVDGVQASRANGPGIPGANDSAGFDPEDVDHIQVVRCGAGLFGDAGRNGVIFVFTTRYHGPMPESDRRVRRGDCGEPSR